MYRERRAAMPTSKTRDKVEGAADKAKGRVKDAAGALTGDPAKQDRGKADKLKGTVKSKKGHVKDLVD
jgi:uncharacterized protein YjbJ (UPF0337 family)